MGNIHTLSVLFFVFLIGLLVPHLYGFLAYCRVHRRPRPTPPPTTGEGDRGEGGGSVNPALSVESLGLPAPPPKYEDAFWPPPPPDNGAPPPYEPHGQVRLLLSKAMACRMELSRRCPSRPTPLSISPTRLPLSATIDDPDLPVLWTLL